MASVCGRGAVVVPLKKRRDGGEEWRQPATYSRGAQRWLASSGSGSGRGAVAVPLKNEEGYMRGMAAAGYR
jgi:hypothetical protein